MLSSIYMNLHVQAVQASKTLKHFSSFAMHLGAEHESTRTVLAGFTGTPVSLSDVHW